VGHVCRRRAVVPLAGRAQQVRARGGHILLPWLGGQEQGCAGEGSACACVCAGDTKGVLYPQRWFSWTSELGSEAVEDVLFCRCTGCHELGILTLPQKHAYAACCKKAQLLRHRQTWPLSPDFTVPTPTRRCKCTCIKDPHLDIVRAPAPHASSLSGTQAGGRRGGVRTRVWQPSPAPASAAAAP